TTARAARSAAATVMPGASKRRLTSLLPAAMPPVSPMTKRLIVRPSTQAGVAQVAVDQRLAPHEDDPAGNGQVRPERDRRGPVTAARVQPDRADDRAHHGRQQDDRQDALEPAPGAQ